MQTLDEQHPSGKQTAANDFQMEELIRQAETHGDAFARTARSFAPLFLPIAKAIHGYLSRPDVQAGLRTWQRNLTELATRVQAIESPGYTPYFERLGLSGLSARLHVGLIRHFAGRFHEEDRDNRVGLSVAHNLAKRPRWHPALAAQVASLRDHVPADDVLDEAFHAAGCPELKEELEMLLQGTSDGDFSCGPRLIAIVARIAPHLPSPRGRPQSFDTVLHQTFLRWSAEAGGRHGYTYGPVPDSDAETEDFIDEATAATRIELQRPSFNPVAARRAERRRLARERSRGTGADSSRP